MGLKKLVHSVFNIQVIISVVLQPAIKDERQTKSVSIYPCITGKYDYRGWKLQQRISHSGTKAIH